MDPTSDACTTKRREELFDLTAQPKDDLRALCQRGIIAAMRFTRQSQSCTAGSRLFLHAKTAKLKIGDPLDEATDIGAIINEKQFKKVCGYIEDGLKQPGGALLFGGLLFAATISAHSLHTVCESELVRFEAVPLLYLHYAKCNNCAASIT
jgi:hypothetical protein